MAIGYRSGYLRKKIGDMVMFVNQNVNGKVKQVARAYTAEVKNPKTARQSNQRSLFVAAKNFRRGFESLLNHSWQGKKYGVQSLNRFSQLVLANKGANYPGFFLQPKNSMKFIPQPWPLSTGSIAGAPAVSLLESGNWLSNLSTVAAGTYETKGALDSAIIAANPFLKDGDMITFCVVLTTDTPTDIKTTSVFIPMYDRYVLDVTSDKDIQSQQYPLITENGLFYMIIERDSGFNVTEKLENHNIVAAGIIYSRLSASGRSWERSTSTMIVDTIIADLFNDTEYVNNCIATFMDESMLTSDWYLNQVGQDTTNPQGGGGGVANSYEQGSVTLANSQTLTNALIATIGGVRKPVASGSGASKACVNYGTEGWQYTPGANLLPEATEAWSLSEFIAAFPDVQITLVEQP